MFAGFVKIGQRVTLTFHTYQSDGSLYNPSPAPAYTIYQGNFEGTVSNGTGVATLATASEVATGWYKISHECLAADGFVAGEQYRARITYLDGSTARVDERTWNVV